MRAKFDKFAADIFDLNNMEQYVEDPTSGIFSYKYLAQCYITAFYWREAMLDHLKGDYMKDRRACYIRRDDKGYKQIIEEYLKAGQIFEYYILGQIQKKT